MRRQALIDARNAKARPDTIPEEGPAEAAPGGGGIRSKASQQRLIEAVRGENGASLEAHGTGTALGDPIEVRAYFFTFLSQILCRCRWAPRRGRCVSRQTMKAQRSSARP